MVLAACGGAGAPAPVANVGPPEAAVVVEVDRDGDWIVGAADRCPADAEDFDVWEDEDGCPDPDDDGDLVLDEQDQCPYTPGTAPGDACPDGCVMIGTTADCILDVLAFVGSAHEDANYTELIDELASYPEIQQITLTNGWFRPEPPAATRPRLEHARDRLRALGIPERVELVLGEPFEVDSPQTTTAIYARITKQRFALDSQFRDVVACSRSAGAIVRPAKPEYRCKGIYP